jgi:hypothetical protein
LLFETTKVEFPPSFGAIGYDGMRAVADSGLVRADPGHHCGWCPYRQRCPEAAAPEDAS